MTQADSPDPRLSAYVWVSGQGCEAVPVGQELDSAGAYGGSAPRYRVIAPRLWQDLSPQVPPPTPEQIPTAVLPYLQAHPLRLHVPGVYDLISRRGQGPWLVLENVPVNGRLRQLYPALASGWPGATAVRRLGWLGQWWHLWHELTALGVATSVLVPENLRVQGWRLRLCELFPEPEPLPLGQLAAAWQPLIAQMEGGLATSLKYLCGAMESGSLPAEQIGVELNYLLIKAAAQWPITTRISGGTHPGPKATHNEDACYPLGTAAVEPLARVAIVADGVGGHDAGEVASQLVVRSLQLQLQGLVATTDSPEGAVPPPVIAQQLAAAIRVANDLVNHHNDQQNRSESQRMGTTLALGVLVPQRVRTETGWRGLNELYVAHVGDSRAYWITADACHLLTVDDDLAGRQVQAGQGFYQDLRRRPEMGALVQAVGTRGAAALSPHVQRLIVEEEGVLLLCTDGLSDRDRVETEWANFVGLVLKEIVPLEQVVASLIDLANRKNGQDNVAVALMHCRPLQPAPSASPDLTPEDELTAASRALLYGEGTPAAPRRRPWPRWGLALAAGVILVVAIALGWVITERLTAPSGQDQEAVE